MDNDPIPVGPDEEDNPADFEPPPERRERHATPSPAREPPCSAEAEEHVIACCLIDGGETLVKCEDSGLRTDDFHSAANRILYSQIASLRDREIPVALDTLVQELMEHRTLEAVGGLPYLLRITGGVPTTARSSYFIGVVREKSQRRALIAAATSAVEQAYVSTEPTSDLLASARSDLDRIGTGRSSDEELSATEYSPTSRVTKPPEIFSAKGTCIATAGNIQVLYSKVKMGKTASVVAIFAAALTDAPQVVDTLGISAHQNKEGKAFLIFDTEQSKYDWQTKVVDTALKRARRDSLPTWAHAYHLTGKQPADCRRLVKAAVKRNAKKHGGVYAVIIDGAGDLVASVNNEEECIALVVELQAMAIEFDCPVMVVLHLNPTAEVDKGRGHLGSHLERKAESNLMLEKGEDEVSRLWATKQRGKTITKDNAICFKWSEEHGMHMSTERPVEERIEKRGGARTRSVPPPTDRDTEAIINALPANDQPFVYYMQALRAMKTAMPLAKDAEKIAYINTLVEKGVVEAGQAMQGPGWRRGKAT